MTGLDRFSLAGKVALVTGGSRGMGREIALGYAEAGADVVVTSRSLADVERVADEVRQRGRRALAVATDVSKADGVENLVVKSLESFGRIDILVNNAGISPFYKRSETVTEEEFDQVVAVNFKGTFLCCQAVGKVMIQQNGGRIINMASVGALVGLPRLSVYSATKGAIVQLTKVLALEWARHNILVNALAPAYVETEFTAGLRNNPALLEMLKGDTALGRLARPDEVVGIAILLASEAGSYFTGTTVIIDGGMTDR
ncbi:MAG: glucose 1-dehydrogenase [Dehalococcoidia bacterium]|nr:glucose 1-dehydrogenase [Dehalococcoidia bacterium]